MRDRFWPARRWLADRLIGQQAYSKNVVQPTWTVGPAPFQTATATTLIQTLMQNRDPGETA